MGILFSQPDVDDHEIYVEEDPDYRAATCSSKFMNGVNAVVNKSLFVENWEHSSSMAFDAIHAGNKLVRFENPQITREGINGIKIYLDLQDKISLIFLLYDDTMSEIALQYTLQLVNGASLDVLDQWISYVSAREIKWQPMLLEALSIVQHYQALRILGFSKVESNARFLPTSKHTSLYIPLKRKMLYRILEIFEQDKVNWFLETVHNDFQTKNLIFERFEYLEMYFLYWASIKYISTENLDNISRALKVVEMYQEAEEFKGTSQINEIVTPREEVPIQSTSLNWERSLSVASASASCSMQEDRITENSYVIDPKLPGICLIINQEYFYSEFDKKYKDLIPNSNQKLEERTGTEVDKNRLINTFKNLNYEIIDKDNLTHFQMKEVIESVVKSVKNHSSLIICILSHGLEGMVYGVNSIPMKIEAIKEIMCTKNKRNLQGKPKVLILQSCQGTHCQEVEDNNEEQSYAMDGPPSTADLLVFYATIPGFGAIRDKKKGTWLIQSLCDIIDNQENANMHLDDICTLVLGEVTSKRWTTTTSSRAMVPMKTSTLTKFFYLPRH